jgi:hypothetical protein
LAVAGCGAGNSAGDSTGNASDAPATTAPSFEDAMVDFAACMRDHGVDMPDPVQSSSGDGPQTFAIQIGGTGPSTGGGPDPAVEEATTACNPILEAAQQNMPKPSAEEEAKMRDQALKFAQCMRDHGVDMPDPTFDSSGAGMIVKGSNDDAPPIDSDKFNEAATACNTDGTGGTFSVSANGGSGPGIGISVAPLGGGK